MNRELPQRGQLLIGSSRAMRNVMKEIEVHAPTPSPILIVGETGTGKERVAAEIHARSGRAAKTWRPVNCASLSTETADSELFGHVLGAFTSAVRPRKGLIRSTEGGTLFLDEIATLPRNVQAKLLRTFDESRIRQLGEDDDAPVDVRFIAATNENIEAMIERGEWRRDFQKRFCCTIELPPLRDRPEDIEELALHFIRTCRTEPGRNSKAERLSNPALELMRQHPWPDNVRGLRHAIQRALARSAPEECLELEPGHFDLDSARTPRPANDYGSAAIAALDALAISIIDDLEAGRRPAQSIDSLARAFPEVSLNLRLAAAFYSRFKDRGLEAKAKSLFGTTLEAVRKLVRP